MFKFLVLLAFVPAILARTPFRLCPGLPAPTAIFMGSRENPCLAEPCQISRIGGAGITYVDFTPAFNTNSIMPHVLATALGLTFEQPIPDHIVANPCSILTSGSCPLSANVPVSYRLEMPVEPGTPLIQASTEITLFGDNQQVIFCYRINTQLVT